MVHLGVLDVAIIVGYFILMVVVGLWSRKKIHNLDDYWAEFARLAIGEFDS